MNRRRGDEALYYLWVGCAVWLAAVLWVSWPC